VGQDGISGAYAVASINVVINVLSMSNAAHEVRFVAPVTRACSVGMAKSTTMKAAPKKNVEQDYENGSKKFGEEKWYDSSLGCAIA